MPAFSPYPIRRSTLRAQERIANAASRERVRAAGTERLTEDNGGSRRSRRGVCAPAISSARAAGPKFRSGHIGGSSITSAYIAKHSQLEMILIQTLVMLSFTISDLSTTAPVHSGPTFSRCCQKPADQFWCAPSSSPHLVSSIAMYIEASANSAWNCE